MNQALIEQYNSYYSSGDDIYGQEPTPIVKSLGHYLSGGKILDVGGGEGRNALYLAEQGFAVTVLDFSEVALRKLDSAAKEKGLVIETKQDYIETFKLNETYDAIITTFVLFHLKETAAKRVIEMAKSHTRSGGVHIHATFANHGELYERNKGKDKFYPSEETYKTLYSDWNIMEIDSYETICHARNKDGSQMKNDVVTLLAVNK